MIWFPHGFDFHLPTPEETEDGHSTCRLVYVTSTGCTFRRDCVLKVHPKHHYGLHLPGQLARCGVLLSCFVHERKHRLVVKYMAKSFRWFR